MEVCMQPGDRMNPIVIEELHPYLKTLLGQWLKTWTCVTQYEWDKHFNNPKYTFQPKQLIAALAEYRETEEHRYFKIASWDTMKHILGYHYRGEVVLPIDTLRRVLKLLTKGEIKDPLAAAILGKMKFTGYRIIRKGTAWDVQDDDAAYELLKASSNQSHSLGCTYYAEFLIRDALLLSDTDIPDEEDDESDQQMKIRLFKEALSKLIFASTDARLRLALPHKHLAELYTKGVKVGDTVVIAIDANKAEEHKQKVKELTPTNVPSKSSSPQAKKNKSHGVQRKKSSVGNNNFLEEGRKRQGLGVLKRRKVETKDEASALKEGYGSSKTSGM